MCDPFRTHNANLSSINAKYSLETHTRRHTYHRYISKWIKTTFDFVQHKTYRAAWNKSRKKNSSDTQNKFFFFVHLHMYSCVCTCLTAVCNWPDSPAYIIHIYYVVDKCDLNICRIHLFIQLLGCGFFSSSPFSFAGLSFHSAKYLMNCIPLIFGSAHFCT